MSRKRGKKGPLLGPKVDHHRQEAVAQFDAAMASSGDAAGTASEMFMMMLDHLEIRIDKLPKGEAKEECFRFYKFFLEMFTNVPGDLAPEYVPPPAPPKGNIFALFSRRSE